MAGQVDARVDIAPGDFVVADDDGVVIVPERLLAEVIEYAEAAEQAEGAIREAIESGEDRESIDRRLDRWALLKARRAEAEHTP
jgi:regulator of RNase E activity RraA